MSITQKKEGNLESIENDFLEKYVTWALWFLAVIVIAATVTGLVESYNGLYIWFAMHGMTGFWADWAPIMLDGIATVGEIGVFVAIARSWPWVSRIIPWAAALCGIAASIAGNVGDKIGHPVSWELTAAVPPVVAAFGIVVGLGILKRVAKDVNDRRKAEKAKAFTLTPQQVADQLLKDNQELMRKLQEKPIEVVDISPPTDPGMNLKGLDVLIPPTEDELPVISQREPATVVATTVEPHAVSREESLAMLRNRPDRGTIYQTGSFPAVS